MRPLLAIALAVVAAGALAQTPPPKREPLPDVPPPPPGVENLTPSEPSVTIRQPSGQQVEEIRQDGRVVALKITPKNGPPYYLVDTTGNGNWVRRNSLDGISVPQWPIKTWQ